MKTTLETMRTEVEALRETIDQSLKDGAAEGDHCPEFLLPLHEAGEWLSWKMQAAGADEQMRENTCFAMGQRCMMRGPGNAYQVAVEVYNAWADGNADTPGVVFGDHLIRTAVEQGDEVTMHDPETGAPVLKLTSKNRGDSR
jgi:hypothetical protein